MAFQPRTLSLRKRYLRGLGYVSVAADAPSHRVFLWDGRVRWVAQGATLPYADATVSAGRRSRFTLAWQIDQGGLTIRRYGWFVLPDGAVEHIFDNGVPAVADDGVCAETWRFVDQQGALTIESATAHCVVRRTLFAAVETAALVERIQIDNVDNTPHIVSVTVPPNGLSAGGVDYCVEMADDTGKMLSMLDIMQADAPVDSQQSAVFWVVYYALPKGTDLLVDCRLEYKKHCETVRDCFAATLCAHTPRPLLNAAFGHAATWGVTAITDTCLGPMPLDLPLGASLANWVVSIPYYALSGSYRGRLASDAAARRFAEDYRRGHLPAGYAPDGTAYGNGNLWLLALGYCYSTLYGMGDYTDMYRALLPALLADIGGLRDAAALALAALVCREMGVWAALAGQNADVTMWRQNVQSVTHRLDACFDDKAQTYRTRGDASKVLALSLLADVDAHARQCAVAIGHLYGGRAALAHKKRDVDDMRLLLGVAALQNAGYHDAAYALWCNYTLQCMLGRGAPYPTDRRDLGAPPAVGPAMAYCYVATVGLWGLRPMGNALGVCLHFPADWQIASLEHLHLGGRVLSMRWSPDALVVRDLFGEIIYEQPLPIGQPIVINL